MHHWNRKCCNFDEIFITSCTASCQNDNFQCRQWWKFHQNDDKSISVIEQALLRFCLGIYDMSLLTFYDPICINQPVVLVCQIHHRPILYKLKGQILGQIQVAIRSLSVTLHPYKHYPGLVLCLRPANERRRYFVTMSLIGWVQA